mgnify:CR=1 FL=1
MKKTIVLLLSIALTSAVFSCKDKTNQQKSITKEVSFTKEGELTLKKAETDSIIATLDIEIADDEYQTQTGLMYRKGMLDSQASRKMPNPTTLLLYRLKAPPNTY